MEETGIRQEEVELGPQHIGVPYSTHAALLRT